MGGNFKGRALKPGLFWILGRKKHIFYIKPGAGGVL
jgi:hypothetical protein